MKKILILIVLFIFCFWITLLTVTPNDYLIVHSLQKSNNKTELAIEKALMLVPNFVIQSKVKLTERDCFGEFTGQSISHVTLLVDIAYSYYPDSEETMDQNDAKDLALYFISKGCSLNEVHPVTKWGPIHTALLFAPENPDFTKLLLKLGANPNLPLPEQYIKRFEGDRAKDIIIKILKSNKSPNLKVYKDIQKFLQENSE